MEIRISVCWEIVVDSQVNPLNINTTAKDVGGDTNALVELLEFLVAFDTDGQSVMKIAFVSNCRDLPFLLAHARVHCDTGEIAFAQQLVQFSRTEGALDEDNDLIELEAVK